MATINKAELIEKVVEKVKKKDIVSQAAIKRIVGAVFDTIQDEVVAGNDVQLVGFGTFTSIDMAARKGHNPITGESIDIAAKKAPRFKAGRGFKDAVNGK